MRVEEILVGNFEIFWESLKYICEDFKNGSEFSNSNKSVILFLHCLSIVVEMKKQDCQEIQYGEIHLKEMESLPVEKINPEKESDQAKKPQKLKLSHSLA